MKTHFAFAVLLFALATACKKAADMPKSKTDYIPIIAAALPAAVIQGEPIKASITCGFHDRFADITFLNFEVKQPLSKVYEIRAIAFYNNINYGISQPVDFTFNKILELQTPAQGVYILKFYSFDKLVQTDTVQVN